MSKFTGIQEGSKIDNYLRMLYMVRGHSISGSSKQFGGVSLESRAAIKTH